MYLLWCCVSLLLGYLSCSDSGDSRTCAADDFHYEYTECDKYGGRWRVAVPATPDRCSGGNPPPAKRGPDCSFTCGPGEFLNIDTQACAACPAGTYSLGGGVRHEDFTSLPTGFSIYNENSSLRMLEAGVTNGAHQPTVNCSSFGWQLRNGYIVYVPGPCLSILSYSVKLVKPGFVFYTYTYPDKNTFFSFQVQNEQCMNIDDYLKRSHVFPAVTEDGSWREEQVALVNGQVLLSWKAMATHGSQKQIVIKKIDVTGIPFTQECTVCPDGTFSEKHADKCSPCPPSTYSSRGSKECLSCNRNTEYSDSRAAKCEKRPACKESDYYGIPAQCDNAGKTKIEYRWLEPKICRDDLADSVRLPATKENVPCAPCNPGMFLKDGTCEHCPRHHYSDGRSGCFRCPSHTAPDYSYQYQWWNVLPNNMKASCQSMESSLNCDRRDSWLSVGNAVKTAHGRSASVYLVLTLNVAGFRNPFSTTSLAVNQPVGSVTFVFETTCVGDCGFYFLEQPKTMSRPVILAEWNGTVSRRSYSFSVPSPAPTVFEWIFVRSQLTDNQMFALEDIARDQATIFLINVTNTLDGGASTCSPCSTDDEYEFTIDGIDKSTLPDTFRCKCVPCPPGSYMVTENRTCVHCPPATYLNTSAAPGPDACVKCGNNLKSADGVECVTDCRFQLGKRNFDLSGLEGVYQVKGVEIFSRDGSRYLHMFNVSLCSSTRVSCSSSSELQLNFQETNVTGLLCKITSIPRSDGNLYANPLILGDRIVSISDKLDFANLNISKEIFPPWQFSQVYFLYQYLTVSRSCSHGFHTVVVFRCDPLVNGTRVELPANCPDGTCDGCVYYMIVSSRRACPICGPDDYEEITEACRNGAQLVHYIPAKHCNVNQTLQQSTKALPCSALSTQAQIAVGAASTLGVLLISLVIFIWKKNQKLEYKYMKLVQSSGGKCELPEAETCALGEGEEDENAACVDRVKFVTDKSTKKTNWLSTNGVKATAADGFENQLLRKASDDNDEL